MANLSQDHNVQILPDGQNAVAQHRDWSISVSIRIRHFALATDRHRATDRN